MTTETPAKRVDAIDFWRGFALLTIFIDHVPENAFQHITIRNFGLSDAAELFVFLSGASVALAYGSRFFNGETWTAVRAVLRRAFTLYWVQVLTSLLIIGLLAAAAGWWDNDYLVDDPDRDQKIADELGCTLVSVVPITTAQAWRTEILAIRQEIIDKMSRFRKME